MIVETFPVGMLACNATIVADETTRDAIVIDGGDGVDAVYSRLRALGARARYLIHTHAHFDHIADVGGLRARTGASAFLHPADLPIYRDQPRLVRLFGLPEIPEPVELDGELHDGQRIAVGTVSCEVLLTPGHTPGSVCVAIGDGADVTLVTGDTLFSGAIGRWDLGGTSMEDIVTSIRRKLLDYPDATAVVPGHGEFTTIGRERTGNPYLR